MYKFSSEIKRPAEIIQFAKDGNYEQAWIINLSDSKPSKEEIEKYVNQDEYEKLIVEYIWNDQSDEERYVLTVIQDQGCLEQDKRQFVDKCFQIFYDRLSFIDLIKRIDREIIGHEFLLQQPVQKVRLGVFNHWFSVGPIEIWNEGEKIDLNLVKQKIESRPEVERSRLNYQGLAFIYNFDGTLPGPYHIFKTPCCHHKNGEWIVDINLVNQSLQKMIK